MGAKLELVRSAPGHAMGNDPAFVDLLSADSHRTAVEIKQGLSQAAAVIEPKFFYDRLGSALFTSICELPEYYPTRTEAAIIDRSIAQLREHLPTAATLIDLGAGDCGKAARLFTPLAPTQYVAVDISAEFVRAAVQRLSREFPAIEMLGLGIDFSRELRLPEAVNQLRRVFLYPGSSIGNFLPDQAVRFLAQVRQQVDADGGLLIGVDLLKSAEVLVPAYDDSLGVTAAFNLNVLNHLNRLIGADFNIKDWRHVGLFNAQAGRVEMHLEARHAVHVRWTDGERQFAGGERIHTENSHKYSPERFGALLREAGFRVDQFWTDDHGWFGVFYARPA